MQIFRVNFYEPLRFFLLLKWRLHNGDSGPSGFRPFDFYSKLKIEIKIHNRDFYCLIPQELKITNLQS